jgi:hypothetical protein
MLSISLFTPNVAQVSWPSNFTTWQLTTTTNLTAPANWQSVSPGPFPFGNALVVFIPITNKSSFFRLQQNGGGGSCVSRNAADDVSRRQQHAELVSHWRHHLSTPSGARDGHGQQLCGVPDGHDSLHTCRE